MANAIVIGVLIGLLFASLMLNLALWVTRLENTKQWRQRAREAEDGKKAAELRSAAQIDAMLERVSTSERLEVQPYEPRPAIDPTTQRYIPDTPEADEAWNDFRGEPDEESA